MSRHKTATLGHTGGMRSCDSSAAGFYSVSGFVFEGRADDQCHIVTDHRQVGFDAKIAAFDLAARLKSGGVGFVDRIDAGAVECHVQCLRLGHPVER